MRAGLAKAGSPECGTRPGSAPRVGRPAQQGPDGGTMAFCERDRTPLGGSRTGAQVLSRILKDAERLLVLGDPPPQPVLEPAQVGSGAGGAKQPSALSKSTLIGLSAWRSRLDSASIHQGVPNMKASGRNDDRGQEASSPSRGIVHIRRVPPGPPVGQDQSRRRFGREARRWRERGFRAIWTNAGPHLGDERREYPP